MRGRKGRSISWEWISASPKSSMGSVLARSFDFLAAPRQATHSPGGADSYNTWVGNRGGEADRECSRLGAVLVESGSLSE